MSGAPTPRLRRWALPLGLGAAAIAQSAAAAPTAVTRANLCVTEGAINELPGARLSVSEPKVRAYLTIATSQSVEARFTYLGPTAQAARLGSGELRRQFGLKLRARDACNLVYAMWRIEPESKLVVSVKSNPGEHTSAQCGNRGYRNIKPRRGTPVPPLRAGESHTLRATLLGTEMQVFADNRLVWDGTLADAAREFDGPVGIRSDNARLQIELRAGEAQAGGHPQECRAAAESSE